MARILIALTLAVSALVGMVSQAHASQFELSVMQDDNNLIYSNASNRTVALNRMKAMGVDAVRVTVLWSAVAPRKKPKNPADPKSYPKANWDKYDDLVRAAQAYGIQVYLDVTPPGPSWTHRKAPSAAYSKTWEPDARQFGLFYQAVAKRYSGTYHDENEDHGVLPAVHWWGIGNEPDQGGWITPQARRIGGHLVATSPGIYRALVISAAGALIRTGHQMDTINFGETAPIGSPPKSERNPLPPALFLREMFCLNGSYHRYTGSAARARGCSNVNKLSVLKKLPKLTYAHHPYTKKLAPTKRDRHRDSITMANLSVLPKLLDRIAAKTKLIPSGLPVVLTEYGYETNPPDPHAGIPLATQAAWLNIGDYLAYLNPRVMAQTQFMLFDAAPLKQYKKNSRHYWFTYQSGLFFFNGRPKPSATAYMLPFVATRSGSQYSFWGQVRFTPNGADQTVYLQRQQGSDWVTEGDPIPVTNSVGFWQVKRPAQKGATYRELWVAPDGSTALASRAIKLT